MPGQWIGFHAWEIVPRVKILKLVVDEVLAFPFTNKAGGDACLCVEKSRQNWREIRDCLSPKVAV
jgi:hypothetical protein